MINEAIGEVAAASGLYLVLTATATERTMLQITADKMQNPSPAAVRNIYAP